MIALLACTTRLAAAEPAAGETVVIVDTDGTPITRRLQQEVEALGFVVRIEREAAAAGAAEALAENGVVATIEVRPSRPGRLNLVILDPKTHDLIRAQLALEAPRDPAAAELVATRTGELLRAVRLSVPSPARTTRPPEPKPAPAPQRQAEKPPARVLEQPSTSTSVSVSAGPALLAVPDWSPSVTATFGAALVTRSGVGFSARAVIPVTAATIQSETGSIEARCSSYQLGALYEWQLAQRLRLRVGAGGELDRIAFRGIVDAPLLGREDRSTAFGVWTSGALSLRLSPHVALASGVSASWGAHRTAVRYAGREVRDWGRPLLLASLGLEWTSR